MRGMVLSFLSAGKWGCCWSGKKEGFVFSTNPPVGQLEVFFPPASNKSPLSGNLQLVIWMWIDLNSWFLQGSEPIWGKHGRPGR